MKRQRAVVVLFCFLFLIGFADRTLAQGNEPNIHVKVELVQLNVAVMDHKGGYITGLNPSDFVVLEDGIRQKIATFAEGNEATRTLIEGPEEGKPKSPDEGTGGGGGSGLRSAMIGANVFVLFDTSNYMYRGFVFAQDAIADFVRSLEGPDRIAFYSYSRDLSRASNLTPDRTQVLRGVRSTVAGDDAALYNALLLTVKDAGQFSG